ELQPTHVFGYAGQDMKVGFESVLIMIMILSTYVRVTTQGRRGSLRIIKNEAQPAFSDLIDGRIGFDHIVRRSFDSGQHALPADLLFQGKDTQTGSVSLFGITLALKEGLNISLHVRIDPSGPTNKLFGRPFTDKPVRGRQVFCLGGISERFF